jgi:hypothetical protein
MDKLPKTAIELAQMIRAEIARHRKLPEHLTFTIVREGETWRASCTAPQNDEVPAYVAQIGDELARKYRLTD